MKNLERDRMAYKIILEAHRSGLTRFETADLLNERGVKPPLNSPWTYQSVGNLKVKIERWDARRRKIIYQFMGVNPLWDNSLSSVCDYLISQIPQGATLVGAERKGASMQVTYVYEKTEFTICAELKVVVKSLK
jgi:hypothetical protein